MKQKQLTAAVLPPSRHLQQGQRSVLWLLPVISIVVLIGWSAITSLDDGVGDDLTEKAPALPSASLRCSVTADAAHDRAEAAERSARDKIARYVFVPAAGLRALELLSEAKSCAQGASDGALVGRIAVIAQRFRARIEREYQDRITRIRRARLSGRIEQALHDVRFLLALFSEHDSPFLAELRRVRLELEAALAAEHSS